MVTSHAVPVPMMKLKRAHARHQQQRAPDIAGQHRCNEMRPDVLGRRKGQHRDGDHRQRHHQARDQYGDIDQPLRFGARPGCETTWIG